MSMTEAGINTRPTQVADRKVQTRFAMPIADDVRLVTVDTARAVRGVTAEEIFELVEDHQAANYLPGFDLSVHQGFAKRREIRIWAAALRQSDVASKHWELNRMLADCTLASYEGLFGPGGQAGQAHVNNSQLERAWCVSNETLIRLIVNGELRGLRVGRNWKVQRASAADFLRRRAI